MKIFKTKHTKKCFKKILAKNNTTKIELSTLRSMYKLAEFDNVYFKSNIHLIFRTICYFNKIDISHLNKMKTIGNSPTLLSLKLRYNLIDGTIKYNKAKLKNSKNRKLAVKQCKETLFKRYGNENYVNVDKCKETKLHRYGDENYNNIDKYKQTCMIRYGVDNVSKSQYFNDLMVSRGKIVDINLKTDFEHYKIIVEKVTKQQNITVLNNFNKRGRLDLNKNAYHLDHKISKHYGFLNNIPPYIIGNINNLEFIPARKNCSKQEDCSTSVEQIISQIKENNENN